MLLLRSPPFILLLLLSVPTVLVNAVAAPEPEVHTPVRVFSGQGEYQERIGQGHKRDRGIFLRCLRSICPHPVKWEIEREIKELLYHQWRHDTLVPLADIYISANRYTLVNSAITQMVCRMHSSHMLDCIVTPAKYSFTLT
jgi:hypothetical protein